MIKRFGIFSVDFIFSFSSGPYPNFQATYLLFRAPPLCPRMHLSAYYDGIVETLLTFTDVFFFSFTSVVRVSFSGELGIHAITVCFLALGLL